jgi:hypothetical protein
MDTATLTRLAALRAQPKFVDEPGTIYNGMRPEHDRRAAETLLNNLIGRLMRDVGELPAKRFALPLFAQTLARFPGHDTEDRERMCRYIEQIAEILGIGKPRGLLTRWLYGYVLGTLVLLFRRPREIDASV